MVTRLEELFDATHWERKHEGIPPAVPLIQVFTEADADAAERCLASLPEDDGPRWRSLWLFDDSVGQALAISELTGDQ